MKKIGLFIGCLLILLFISFANSTDFFGGSQIPPLDPNDTFCLLSSELIPRGSTPLFTVSTEKIFLFYDRDGLVNVYSHKGNFLYGLQIETTKKGTGNITSDEKYLYVKSCGNTIYIFEDTALLRTIRKSECPDIYEQVEKQINRGPNHFIDNTTYYYLSESNSIAQRTNNGPFQQIVTMPKEHTDAIGLCLLLLGIAALAHFVCSHRILNKG